VTLVVLSIGGLAAYVLTRPSAAASNETAALTVLVGAVQVERSGTSSFTPAKTGRLLSTGDEVRTGEDGRAAITFPDGTITRLDSSTSLTIKALARATGGGLQVDLEQDAGKTWNNVKQLAGDRSFKVRGPNSTTADVRGTEFEVIVDRQPGGPALVRIDVWSGSVAVSGTSGAQALVSTGQSTTVGPVGPPAPPAPIPPADAADGWTVFNSTSGVKQASPSASPGMATSPSPTPTPTPAIQASASPLASPSSTPPATTSTPPATTSTPTPLPTATPTPATAPSPSPTKAPAPTPMPTPSPSFSTAPSPAPTPLPSPTPA
jgi:ferric-dicitrate binding protein FerR (iron transport regulator)